MGVISCGTTMLDQGVFKNIGAVTWDTTAKTSGFTAVSGNGYFVNTTSASITVTLPASPSAGDIVGIKDYANTADTNQIVIGRNGSNIQGTADNYNILVKGGSALLVYVDGTQGWKVTSASQASDIIVPEFIVATGGTILTNGDFKTHIFTGPGTFTVCSAGNPGGSDSVDYLVIAGGAGASGDRGGGAGAGGFRVSNSVGCAPAPTMSPLSNPTGIPVSVTGYPITIGSGGAGTPSDGTSGSSSVFSTITSAGGGHSLANGFTAGGSGSGGYASAPGAGGCAGAGNTPPVSPPQGNPGGNGAGPPGYGAGGGGGAGAAGSNGTGSPIAGGAGGAGSFVAVAFMNPGCAPTYGEPGPVASTRYFAGGGGGSYFGTAGAGTAGVGGVGGGGDGADRSPKTGEDGTANTGGGGGGGNQFGGNGLGGDGGSGIVMIRYKFQ